MAVVEAFLVALIVTVVLMFLVWLAYEWFMFCWDKSDGATWGLVLMLSPYIFILVLTWMLALDALSQAS